MVILAVVATVVLMLATVAGVAYLALASLAVLRFVRTAPLRPSCRPPMSVLKPLCGEEPGLREALRSFCTLDYPNWQIVFGVQDPRDPAIAVVRWLIAEHPGADITLVIDERTRGANRKVANLLSMLPQAKHDVLVIADGDVSVPPDYLDALAAGLEQPDTGVVTCLYTGRPAGGLWARLGAVFIDHGFLPLVLVGRAMGRRDGCFGATMALRRAVLDRLGGLERFRDQLADDYALGAAVRELGLETVLSPCLVGTTVSEASAAELIAHELRWMRTIRSIEAAGHAGSLVTYPVPVALLALAASSVAGWSGLGLAGLGAALAARMAAGRVFDRALGRPPTPLWLMPCRDLLSFALVLASFCGTEVSWRGTRYHVDSNGRLHLHGEKA